MTQWTDNPGASPPSFSDPDAADAWYGRTQVAPPPAPSAPARPPLQGSFQTPPPPLYPPLEQFPDPTVTPPTPPRRRGRTVGLIAIATVIGLLVALLGFAFGRALRNDTSSALGSTQPASATGASATEADTENRTASSVATDGQDGPVTEAPALDPDLVDEPAAAVNRAVSPAVVQIETGSGLGTGFIYDGQGYILTAAHVVSTSSGFGGVGDDFERDVAVMLADGSKVPGTVLGSDLNNDVAVVKIDPIDDMPVAALALGEQPEVGTIAIAIGSPFGLDQTVTQGIVSATNRPVPSPNDNLVSMIQTDAAINSGNSGGPLVNREGRVIGINTQIRTDSGDNAGIGFAVPIDLAYDVAQSLIAGKPIQLGYLGVRGDDPAFGTTGAMVVRVEAASPAADAGLEEGDVITEANGQTIRSFEQLASIIRATDPGETLDLVVERSGATLDIEVTVGQATTR